MREVNVSIITDNIKEMCIEANHFLTDDMKNVFENAVKNEESALGKQVLGQLEENLKVAGEDMIPICQDTGMAVVFINVGQDVHLTGGDITDAINEGVRRGYVEGYLRKSVVKDPIYRENTKDNTPAVSIITDNIKEMCIEANHFLTDDMKNVFENAVKNEESALGKQVLGQLEENLKVAGEDMIPICQDTGMAVVFINVGQDVHLTGGDITDAINEGVRRGYVEGYLRKSVVKDPIYRENTKDNTPAVIHFNIVPGDKVDITVAPKGFGSENMSRVFMLKPADGIEGVKEAILTAVKDAGPNACPPMVVGVGIGGTFEKCAYLAKKALTRDLNEESPVEYVRNLEKEMLEKINKLGIGPGGLGGTQTALAINIETYPTHIAGLPVAVNICCHVNRHSHRVI